MEKLYMFKQKTANRIEANIVYSFFSIAIPSIYVLSVHIVLRSAFSDLNIIPWWFFFLALITNIASSRILLHLKNHHGTLDSYIRIHFFIYFPSAIIAAITFHKTPTMIIYIALLFTLQWFILYLIFNKFKEYLEFLKSVNNQFEEKFKSDINTYSLMIQNTNSNLKELKKSIQLMHFFLFFIVGLMIMTKVSFPLTTLLICSSSMLIGLIFIITISVCIDEYRFYVEGFSIDSKMTGKRIVYGSIVIVISIILVFPAIHNSHFFTPDDIAKFLEWLFPGKEKSHSAPLPPYNEYGIQDPELRKIIPKISESPAIFDLSGVFDFLGMIIIPLLLIGFLFFIFKPLFKKNIMERLKKINPLILFYKGWKGFLFIFKQIVRTFFTNITSLFHADKKQNKNLIQKQPAIPPKNEKTVSIKKRFQTNHVVKMFTKLIHWGQKQNIIFHPSMGPKEYMNIIAEKNRELKSILENISDIFEEALFSDHIMESEIIKTYTKTIKSIISSHSL
ncbi:MAG: hypothetical protein JXR70_03435 [Spirochaetales bacterium]|nr:hypothetical protein [Spirochaetales bacterium]